MARKTLPSVLLEMIEAGRSRKAEDARVLDLRKVSTFADYFVFLTGSNTRQVQAIADAVEERLRELKLRPASVEGYAGGEWILLDYIDIIVHVFLPAKREHFGLERLWHDADDVTPKGA